MFQKCLFYLLAIYFYVCLTKSDNHFKDLNILLDRDGWKNIDDLWKPRFVVECDQDESNPDGQIIDAAELLKKDESQNEIVTEENYKLKVQKLFLLYSAVHAHKLIKIIDILRGFWELCETESVLCKNSFLNTLVLCHETFVNMLDALSFIAKFKSKGPLIISDFPINGVTIALKHLKFLSNSFSQSIECVKTELNGAYNSIKKFIELHFRPVPSYITDDQNNFSKLTITTQNITNNNNTTLEEKLNLLIIELCSEMNQYYYYHVNILGFCFYKDSHLVDVAPLTEQNIIKAPVASDKEDDD